MAGEQTLRCYSASFCLQCPLPRCRYDVKPSAGHRSRSARQRRDTEIFRQQAVAGKSTAELARAFDLSRRTIQRIIRKQNTE